jgi:hypothetical protein
MRLISDATATKELAAEAARETAGPVADAIVKVDLDDRAFLFPSPKQVTQLHLLLYRQHMLRLECAFAFNESRAPHGLFDIVADDAPEFSRRLVESVYRAQSSLIVTRHTNLSITVVANGYILQFGDTERPRELFLSTGCIWRVCGAIARGADFISPIKAN